MAEERRARPSNDQHEAVRLAAARIDTGARGPHSVPEQRQALSRGSASVSPPGRGGLQVALQEAALIVLAFEQWARRERAAERRRAKTVLN